MSDVRNQFDTEEVTPHEALDFFRRQQAYLQTLSESHRESMKTDKSSTLMQLYFSLADARNDFDFAVNAMAAAIGAGEDVLNAAWKAASMESYDLCLAYGDPEKLAPTEVLICRLNDILDPEAIQ